MIILIVNSEFFSIMSVKNEGGVALTHIHIFVRELPTK